ncbi:MAG: hypothetical protein IJU79_01315 [Desulfovibrionaceae bacterium]|nr:hypothetical protein [Desulfovibrionaceae bacterium]
MPDVANNFGIKCENLFDFMRQMHFKLSVFLMIIFDEDYLRLPFPFLLTF